MSEHQCLSINQLCFQTPVSGASKCFIRGCLVCRYVSENSTGVLSPFFPPLNFKALPDIPGLPLSVSHRYFRFVCSYSAQELRLPALFPPAGQNLPPGQAANVTFDRLLLKVKSMPCVPLLKCCLFRPWLSNSSSDVVVCVACKTPQVINAPLADVSELKVYFAVSTNSSVLRSLKEVEEAEGSLRQRQLVYVTVKVLGRFEGFSITKLSRFLPLLL